MTTTCPHCGRTIYSIRHLDYCPLHPDTLRAICDLMRGSDWTIKSYLARKPANLPGIVTIRRSGGWGRVLEALTGLPMAYHGPLRQDDTGWEESPGLPVLRQYEERIGGRMCVVSEIR